MGLTPYHYAANNPIRYIDIHGDSVVVLNAPNGAHGAGHQAVLIGNKDNGYIYISKDGYRKNPFFKSQSIYTIKPFKSIEEFKNSNYNYVIEGHDYDAKNVKFKLDKNGNKIQRYESGFEIKTNPETDAQMVQAATNSAQSNYQLGKKDCSDVVTDAMDVGETVDGSCLTNGEKGIEFDKPVNKQKNIEKYNDGTNIDLTPSQENNTSEEQQKQTS